MRVNVLGASGSGTSTLGKSLAAALSLPHFESDDFFHGPSDPPFQNPRSGEERYELIGRALRPDHSWVLSGGLAGWSPYPELNFTCIVFLYVPTATRIERLRRRERERFGERVLAGGDMHHIHEEFIAWASRYDAGDIEGKTLSLHERYLREQSCPILEFREEYPLSEMTEKVVQHLRGA